MKSSGKKLIFYWLHCIFSPLFCGIALILIGAGVLLVLAFQLYR